MKHWRLLLLLIPIYSFGHDSSSVNFRVENRIIPPDSLVLFPEVEAEFPGGLDSLMRFVSVNVVYPPIELYECNPTPRVYVSMIVERDGALSNFEIFRGAEKKYNDAAIDCFRKMPPWMPARDNGVTVRTKIYFPVVFAL